ncbi:hypothetical protein K449DRAFT_157125 [Hypoxylon sp. EC38]|nr:hypothetical protein K449DRAFT_157125 [Hypoxylon sp. EC38]
MQSWPSQQSQSGGGSRRVLDGHGHGDDCGGDGDGWALGYGHDAGAVDSACSHGHVGVSGSRSRLLALGLGHGAHGGVQSDSLGDDGASGWTVGYGGGAGRHGVDSRRVSSASCVLNGGRAAGGVSRRGDAIALRGVAG